MQFGIIIQARCGSTRFPKKILQKIDHRLVIEFMLDHLEKKFKKNNIIVATTIEKQDNKLVRLLKKRRNKFFRGSESNVLSRYLKCAKKFKIKNIIRLTSDCPLVDLKLIENMKKNYLKHNLDYLSNTYPPLKSTYPDGSDIEIFNYKSLLKGNKFFNNNENKEHVTNLFWKNKKIYKSSIIKNTKNLSNYKYSLDYKNELLLLKKIVEILKNKKLNITADNIVNIIKNNKRLNIISKKNLIKFKKNRLDLFKN